MSEGEGELFIIFLEIFKELWKFIPTIKVVEIFHLFFFRKIFLNKFSGMPSEALKWSFGEEKLKDFPSQGRISDVNKMRRSSEFFKILLSTLENRQPRDGTWRVLFSRWRNLSWQQNSILWIDSHSLPRAR